MTVDAARLAAWWGLPFAGMLLSLALLPLVAPRFWHRHTRAVVLAWSLAFLAPWAAVFGPAQALHGLAHALLADYLPFITLLTALFTTAGGLHIRIGRRATPASNVAMMLIGALLASVMGTTGASMVLIRPLLRANAGRRHAAHVVVFFIFIVANIGGALTPLGDPPLFLGFLHGVGFFWTTRHLLAPMLFLLAALLAIFYVLDVWWTRQEPLRGPREPGAVRVRVEGAINLIPLAFIVALVLLSGVWKPTTLFQLLGVELGSASLLRDAGLLLVTWLSLAMTPVGLRRRNAYSWAPLIEVVVLFFGIFVTMIPVTVMLQAGETGAFAGLLRSLTGAGGEPLPSHYFWVTGLLSSFLDNAPTYLVFFKLAGGDAALLMTERAATLTAISAGAVFMGAMTYIGNAPNLMVKAIAESHGVRMPGFVGYLVWSCAVLLPLLVIMTVFFDG